MTDGAIVTEQPGGAIRFANKAEVTR
jgi:hypothetical protein